jgi:RNA polymerase sigma factor for flagellar operon FliA
MHSAQANTVSEPATLHLHPDAPRQDSVRTVQQLAQSCQGLVRSIAWKIKQKLPPQVDLEDLIGYGQLGLLQAAQDFDATRGGQFTTYAYYRIRGAILDGLSQMAWFSRADYHRARYERLAQEVLSAEAADSSEASSSAGPPGEVRAGESLNGEVGWFADLASKLVIVYLASGAEDGADANSLVDGGEPPPAQAMARELKQNLAEIIEALPAPARSLIRATYFEGVTLQEAGRRLGISKAWASRLHAKTLGQLARSLRRAEQVS